jgi:hypothetical protein
VAASVAMVDDMWFCRKGSRQAHSIIKIPVRKEASTSIRVLILYDVLVVNI